MIFRRHIRRTSKKISIKLLFAVVIFIGIGYAYVNSSLNIVGSTSILKSNWDVHFENLTTINGTLNDDESITLSDDKKSINFNVNLETIDDFYQIDVDIVNKGDIDAMLNEINFSELTDSQKEYLEFYATYNNGNTININDSLKAGEFDVITVTLKYKDGIDLGTISEETDYLDLTLTMNYGQATKKAVDRGTNLISIMSKNSISDKNIDFSQVSSETNGQGVYTYSGTENDINPIYYYRGDVKNNNINFGGFCWKIVRTTDTGGIKIIYNGIPSSTGVCDATKEASTIGKSTFNDNITDTAYAGYMFGKIESSTKEETHANIYSSIAKIKIDDWFKNNLLEYTQKLEDTIWCNERSGMGSKTQVTSSVAFDRRGSPSLECSTKENKFTVNNKVGNAKLTYPIALITSDELMLAGAVWGKDNINKEYYLYNGVTFWSMTPSVYSQTFKMNIFDIYPDGHLENHQSNSGDNYIRPMISLKRGTRFIQGNGTTENPYVVN